MRETGANTKQSMTLEKGLAVFINALSGKNRSAATIRAYQTDIQQFIMFLHEISVSAHTPQDVEKVGTHLRRDTVIPQWFQASKAAAASDGHAVYCWVTAVICQLSRLKRIPEKVDILEYFSFLAKKDLTGVARARKLSAIREYFRFLEGLGEIEKSPTSGVETPKREKNARQFLRSDEYTKMLSLAGANARDYAILQVFLQTGIRVSELASLTLRDIDFIKPSITVLGKGNTQREIALEKKGIQALRSYLGVRMVPEGRVIASS